MSKTGYRLKGNEKLTIFPLSDIHLGSDGFNLDYFEYALDILDRIRLKRIYLVGDMVECASKKVGDSAYRQVMTLDDQIDEVISYLKPFRKDIIYSVTGNHEARGSDIDFNVTKMYAKKLRASYGHQVIDSFNINGKPFRVYLRHGKGSAAYAHLAQGKTLRETQMIDADLYLEGHNHRLDFFSQPVRTLNSCIGLGRRYYAFTGSFLKYKGYPDAKTLPPLPEAFQTININKDFVVRNTAYMIDQVRPDLFEPFGVV